MILRERPVICLVQDEEILKQYIFTKKLWNYKGKCQLVPKDEGYGIIILAFQYQEFVFGYPLTITYLQTINEYCTIHPKYVDTEAETTILGHNHKEPITMGSNNFYQNFEYGAIAEGYCTYDRMVLQLQDCVDILKDIHTGVYLIFLFDSAYGHDR